MKLRIGDTVAFTADWLERSGHQEVANWRGTIRNLSPMSGGQQLVVIHWDHGRVTQSIGSNLTIVGCDVNTR